MRIIVCMKQVLDTRVPLQVNDSVTQKEPAPVYITNPADCVALQKALELKGSLEGTKITVITAGPIRTEQVLRMALASGADQAIHLIIKDDTLEVPDAYTTAFALSKVCKELGYTLILCGHMSLDTAAAQIHAFLAELLDIPRVTGVVRLEISQKRIRLWRRLERGRRQVVECPLPALLAIDSLAGHRYASEFNLMQAAERQIRQLTLADMGLSQTDIGPQASLVRVVNLSSPKPRVKKIYTPDSSMTASQRMSYLLSAGTAGRKQGNLLEGTADYLATQIVEYLTKEGIKPK